MKQFSVFVILFTLTNIISENTELKKDGKMSYLTY
jgi:hypothetical protein